jgi:reductive dehalogenase
MIILLLTCAAIFFLFFLYATFISIYEKEYLAAGRFFLTSILLPVPYILNAFIEFDYQFETGLILLAITLSTIFLLIIPFGNRRNFISPVPSKRIDERDTMFSRNELKSGTERFDTYYKRNPELKILDDSFRKKPGLLNSKSSQYNPVHFNSADASFDTIAALKDEVDGPVSESKINLNQTDIASYIKSWSRKLGAVNCGITELKDYHFYSIRGRGKHYGKPVKNNHKYAIAFTVEMSREMIQSAPKGSIVMESAQQYLESGRIAVQVAHFIRRSGYSAKAHIDGNYEVVCPLVARDAGLGEIGRMGLLMTPGFGPRVRIAVVTTELPMLTDEPLNDYSTIDFCIKCKKCAVACPSKAISFEDIQRIDGVERWQINQEDCFTYWCTTGTDCGRCVSVCPYSHPDNILHNIVRCGNKNSSLFRSLAVKLDDVYYGNKPHIAELPDWLQIDAEE